MKIAMIEDDGTIAFAVQTFLKRCGLETSLYSSLREAEDIDIENFDLILLDENLPDGSGFDYLSWLRDFSDIPVIMLTVKSSEHHILKGFEKGADDYITKPFSLPILKARVERIFRRREGETEDIIFCELVLNLKSRSAKLEGIDLELSRQEFNVLFLLLENKDSTVLRERMIDFVWGNELYEVNDNTLTVTIKRLRKKLGRYSKYLRTVRSLGYMWEKSHDQ